MKIHEQIKLYIERVTTHKNMLTISCRFIAFFCRMLISFLQNTNIYNYFMFTAVDMMIPVQFNYTIFKQF